ncbi:MAG TPA: anti-sigma factor [Rudaea sp.]
MDDKQDSGASHPISDNELILYFYRDGLAADRIAVIDDALFAQPGLRARYTELQRLLHEIDCAPAIEPDAELAQRVWRRLAARIDADGNRPRSHVAVALRAWLSPQRAFVGACLLVLAAAVGFVAGRHGTIDRADAHAMSARVLDAYVAEHLRATEGLLLTAVNSDSAELHSGNRELAAALVESNRLYALAAARAGNARLADFLRQLEPVLLDLANRPGDSSVQSVEGLRDYLRKTDLLFQVRATQARIDPADKHRT